MHDTCADMYRNERLAEAGWAKVGSRQHRLVPAVSSALDSQDSQRIADRQSTFMKIHERFASAKGVSCSADRPKCARAASS